MKWFFINVFEEMLEKYTEMLRIETLNKNQVKEITEFAFLLIDVMNKLKLRAQEKVLLERLLSKINGKLYVAEKIFYYHSLYMLPQKFYNGESMGVGEATYRANIDINIMRLQIKCERVTGSSEDEYFFSRGETGLLRAVNNLLNHSDDIESLIPAFYTLLNYSQAIMDYLEIGTLLFREESKKLAKQINRIIYNFLEKVCVKERLNRDFQLKFFMLNELRKYNELTGESFEVTDIEIEGFKSFSNVNKKIWAYLNYVYIRKVNFKEEFKADFNMNYCNEINRLKNLEKIVLLRDCLLWVETEEDVTIEDIRIPKFELYRRNNWFYMKDYFNGSDKLNSIIINDTDRKEVRSLGEDKLIEFILKTMKNIEPNSTKRISSKSHDYYSTAIEIPIKSNFIDGTYYLCIIFKPEEEIKGKINYDDMAYKVFKSFVNFGVKAIMVVISLSEGAETFNNVIKKSTTELNWTIETIMGDTLIKLLKYNNLI